MICRRDIYLLVDYREKRMVGIEREGLNLESRGEMWGSRRGEK